MCKLLNLLVLPEPDLGREVQGRNRLHDASRPPELRSAKLIYPLCDSWGKGKMGVGGTAGQSRSLWEPGSGGVQGN